MDERRRLLERVFSREGAAEALEDRRDPATGETVRMTPSQWALAEYDRLHGAVIAGDGEERAPAPGSSALASGKEADVPGTAQTRPSTDDAHRDSPASRRRLSKSVPYLSTVAGLLLGAVVTFAIEGMAASPPNVAGAGQSSPVSTGSGGEFATGLGDGDEGDTLQTVMNYFVDTPYVAGLSAAVTRGFDATSFHLVARAVSKTTSSAIYAARRLDDEYCLVAVTDGNRAAETCGSMDVLARRGLWLTEDAVSGIDGDPVAVTATWETDGTISWEAVPVVG